MFAHHRCAACAAVSLLCLCGHSLQYNGGKDMTAGSFTSTADIDFYIDVDANGTELVIVSDNITTRHQVRHRLPCMQCAYGAWHTSHEGDIGMVLLPRDKQSCC